MCELSSAGNCSTITVASFLPPSSLSAALPLASSGSAAAAGHTTELAWPSLAPAHYPIVWFRPERPTPQSVLAEGAGAGEEPTPAKLAWPTQLVPPRPLFLGRPWPATGQRPSPPRGFRPQVSGPQGTQTRGRTLLITSLVRTLDETPSKPWANRRPETKGAATPPDFPDILDVKFSGFRVN